MKRLILFLLFASVFASAQTTTFIANLKDLATNTPANPEAGPVYLELTLRNIGSAATPTLCRVNGVGLVSFPVNLYPVSGLISQPVYDETFISCGGSTGVSYYHIRMYQGDSTRSAIKKLLFEDDFDVEGATFNLNSAAPRSAAVITPPPATAVLTNPSGNQTVVQPGSTALTVNRLSAGFAQSSNGTDMVPGQRFTDTSPTGNFLNFKNAAGSTSLWDVDVTGTLLAGIIPAARISGVGACANEPALTGDVTSSTGSCATTMSSIQGTAVTGTTGAGKAALQALNTVTFSATPTFNCALGSLQKITLTGNVTSSSISNCQPGQIVTFEICQDATGGRTFVQPTALAQWSTIPSAATACSAQVYVFETSSSAFPDMMPALTGDVTSSPTSTATTVAKIAGVSVGTPTGTAGSAVVLATSPTITTPVIASITGTASNPVTVQGGSGSANDLIVKNAAGTSTLLTVTDSAGNVILGKPGGVIQLPGATSQAVNLAASANAGNGTLTLPATTDTLAVLGTAQSWGAVNQTNMQLVTPKIGGTTITNTPVLVWAIDNNGGNVNLTSSAFSQFTPISGITIKRIEVIISGTAGAGCTTAPIVRITDGTTNLDTSITNATTTFTNNVNQNYAAGAVLTMKTVAGSGCTTSPTGPFVNVQYIMQ